MYKKHKVGKVNTPKQAVSAVLGKPYSNPLKKQKYIVKKPKVRY